MPAVVSLPGSLLLKRAPVRPGDRCAGLRHPRFHWAASALNPVGHAVGR